MAVQTEYIKQQVPPLPDDPDYYRVIWKKNGNDYCLDTGNAKSLLKDKILTEGNRDDLKIIIEGMRR